MKRRKVFTLFVLFLLIAASHLIAQDFYWENEEILVSSGAEFSRTASGGGVIASVWQDEVSSNNNGGSFYLSMAVSENGMDWSFNKRFLGPFNYTGKQSYFFSEVINDSGDIILAVSENDNSVRIYSSSDKGQTFSEISRLAAFPVRVSPYISLRSDGGFILFFTQETNKDNFGSLGIYYSVSDDGKSWTDNQSLAPNYNGNFLPSHTSYNGREYVAFQAFHIGSTSTFQIYIKYSDNGGVSWSDAQLLSDFKDTNEFFDGDPFVFDNQRPYLSTTPDGIKLVWERAYAGSNPQIYYADVNPDGTLKNNAEQVTSGSAECRSPKIIFHEGNEYLLWFDNRAGDYHNVLAYRDGLFWSEDDLNYDTRGSSFFGSVLSSGKDLYVVWENEYRGRNRLMLLSPDKTVTAPVLRASNFAAGRAAAQSNFIVRWNSPSDSSGIAGYSYSWSRDKDDVPEHDLKMLDKNRTVKIKLDEDGSWFFHLIAQDYAGNWSKPSVIEMNRDTTPPGKVVFTQPDLDDNGALLSNTSVINWTPPPDDDIAGYSYRLQYMGRWNWGGNIEDLRFKASASRVQTKGTTYSFRNIDNGMWALNIRAIDKVGNAGETESIVLRLNKYIPVTYITSIDSSKDALGSIKLELRGRGFSVGGLVKQVILDRDGRKPYDYVYNIEDELYTVKSDRIINGPVIENIDAGTYKIGLLHPRRGLYFTRSGIKIESSGTVKLGDFSSVPKPVISIAPKKKFTLPFKYIILSLIVIFLLFLFIITLRRTAKVVSEARVFKHQVTALIEGKDITDKEKEKRVAQMAKIRMGLRVKFILLFTILVLLVVAMISVPVTIMTLENQRKILATGLEDRAKVLLESITSGSRTFLPSENIIELSTLPAQMSALGDDAVYVTITSSGKSSEENYDPDIYDYVWVTNDKNISDKAT
ncbi:MAG: sialidase family protein, partial [Spirochaetales bacterium]|nr:sialidase family protein [Spirochaetales bacterium]